MRHPVLHIFSVRYAALTKFTKIPKKFCIIFFRNVLKPHRYNSLQNFVSDLSKRTMWPQGFVVILRIFFQVVFWVTFPNRLCVSLVENAHVLQSSKLHILQTFLATSGRDLVSSSSNIRSENYSWNCPISCLHTV